MLDSRTLRCVVFVCDVSPSLGAGHVMRCLALVEELALQKCRSVLVCGPEAPEWVVEAVLTRGATLAARPDDLGGLMSLLADLSPDLVFVDSYTLDLDSRSAVRERWPLATMVDGEAGTAYGDVVVDQNLGAELFLRRAERGTELLLGAKFALIRDEFLRARRHSAASGRDDQHALAPKVLITMGGTDPTLAAPFVLELLAGTRVPFSAAVRCSRLDARAAIQRVRLHDGQTMELRDVGLGIAEEAAQADLVISAAGSSVWELLSVGACAAVVQVADNQSLGYKQAVARRVCIGLGTIQSLRSSESARSTAQSSLRETLLGPNVRYGFRKRALVTVDGRGRGRVAQALSAAFLRRSNDVPAERRPSPDGSTKPPAED